MDELKITLPTSYTIRKSDVDPLPRVVTVSFPTLEETIKNATEALERWKREDATRADISRSDAARLEARWLRTMTF